MAVQSEGSQSSHLTLVLISFTFQFHFPPVSRCSAAQHRHLSLPTLQQDQQDHPWRICPGVLLILTRQSCCSGTKNQLLEGTWCCWRLTRLQSPWQLVFAVSGYGQLQQTSWSPGGQLSVRILGWCTVLEETWDLTRHCYACSSSLRGSYRLGRIASEDVSRYLMESEAFVQAMVITGWFHISCQVQIKVLVITFKVLLGLESSYLSRRATGRWLLRSSNGSLLWVRWGRSLLSAGGKPRKLWNTSARQLCSEPVFRKLFKTMHFRLPFICQELLYGWAYGWCFMALSSVACFHSFVLSFHYNMFCC